MAFLVGVAYVGVALRVSIRTACSSASDTYVCAPFEDVSANVLGCFLMGALATKAELHASERRVVAIVSDEFPFGKGFTTGMRSGFCSALTSFSAWIFAMSLLFFRRRPLDAIFGVCFCLVLFVGSAYCGRMVANATVNRGLRFDRVATGLVLAFGASYPFVPAVSGGLIVLSSRSWQIALLAAPVGLFARVLAQRALNGRTSWKLPWGTLCVNVVGVFIEGALHVTVMDDGLKLGLQEGACATLTTVASLVTELNEMSFFQNSIYLGCTLVPGLLAGLLPLWVAG